MNCLEALQACTSLRCIVDDTGSGCIPEGVFLCRLVGFLGPLVFRLQLFYPLQEQPLSHMPLNALHIMEGGLRAAHKPGVGMPQGTKHW